jgi:hypothetical protein
MADPAILAAVYDSSAEVNALTQLYIRRYGGMLRAVHGLLTRATNRAEEPVDDVAMRHVLLEARARAVRADATTQFAIAAMLAEGTRKGLSASEIAYGTKDFPGIQGLFSQTWASRPMTIARTELQQAALVTAVDRFRAARGLVRAMIAHDGDYDAQCQMRNGREYALNNPPTLLHPNCRLTVSPVFVT